MEKKNIVVRVVEQGTTHKNTDKDESESNFEIRSTNCTRLNAFVCKKHVWMRVFPFFKKDHGGGKCSCASCNTGDKTHEYCWP